jgi:ppGpp synthetase/RelA/SpoT-type nucleotidyltranferase
MLHRNTSTFEVPTGDSHGAESVLEYRKVEGLYAAFAEKCKEILIQCIDANGLQVQSLEARAKDSESFLKKATTVSESDVNTPKYMEPLKEITDLAGVRVITYFLETVDDLDKIIDDEFRIIERLTKDKWLDSEEILGYQSVHYLICLKDNRVRLTEYKAYSDLMAEVQVRTILQHAWAKIEHDFQYKSAAALPGSIRRRFVALAGVLEIADREFQAIHYQRKELLEAATVLAAEGRLDEVELTSDSLKVYLDNRFGPDGRMGAWNYSYAVRLSQAWFQESWRTGSVYCWV